MSLVSPENPLRPPSSHSSRHAWLEGESVDKTLILVRIKGERIGVGYTDNLITDVVLNSVAERSGIQRGMVLRKIDGFRVDTTTEVRDRFATAGDRIEVVVEQRPTTRQSDTRAQTVSPNSIIFRPSSSQQELITTDDPYGYVNCRLYAPFEPSLLLFPIIFLITWELGIILQTLKYGEFSFDPKPDSPPLFSHGIRIICIACCALFCVKVPRLMTTSNTVKEHNGIYFDLTVIAVVYFIIAAASAYSSYLDFDVCSTPSKTTLEKLSTRDTTKGCPSYGYVWMNVLTGSFAATAALLLSVCCCYWLKTKPVINRSVPVFPIKLPAPQRPHSKILSRAGSKLSHVIAPTGFTRAESVMSAPMIATDIENSMRIWNKQAWNVVHMNRLMSQNKTDPNEEEVATITSVKTENSPSSHPEDELVDQSTSFEKPENRMTWVRLAENDRSFEKTSSPSLIPLSKKTSEVIQETKSDTLTLWERFEKSIAELDIHISDMIKYPEGERTLLIKELGFTPVEVFRINKKLSELSDKYNESNAKETMKNKMNTILNRDKHQEKPQPKLTDLSGRGTHQVQSAALMSENFPETPSMTNDVYSMQRIISQEYGMLSQAESKTVDDALRVMQTRKKLLNYNRAIELLEKQPRRPPSQPGLIPQSAVLYPQQPPAVSYPQPPVVSFPPPPPLGYHQPPNIGFGNQIPPYGGNQQYW